MRARVQNFWWGHREEGTNVQQRADEWVLLNAFVLALVDEGILGSANCQNALSKGLPDGSPLSLFCGVSLEMSA